MLIKLKEYWHHNNELCLVYATGLLLLGSVILYAFDWQFALKFIPVGCGIMIGLTIFYWRLPPARRVVLFSLAYSVGVVIALLGAHSHIAGSHISYSNALGFKVWGVPILFGAVWAGLTIAAWQLALFSSFSTAGKVMIAVGVLMMFDLLCEQFASVFGIWTWRGGVIPLGNYLTWLLAGFATIAIYAFNDNKQKPSLYGAAILPLLAFYFWVMLLVS